MSGLEIAGVLLGAFPLIISSVEHWRDVAKVGGYFWRVKHEYNTCRREVQFYELIYRSNLKELITPILDDTDEVNRLLSDPGGQGWSSKAMHNSLMNRLQESHSLYMEIVCEMNDTAQELRKQLAFDKATIQDKLASAHRNQPPASGPQSKPSKRAIAKEKWDYEAFRIKFSFGEPVRSKLFDQFKECNERLEKLLRTSDRLPALDNTGPANTKPTQALEKTLKSVRNKSDLLFKSLQGAWQCTCWQHHYASLRLEHRKQSEMWFDIVLTFADSSAQLAPAWSWKALRAEQLESCGALQKCAQPVPVPLKHSTQIADNNDNKYSTRASLLAMGKRKYHVAFKTAATTIPKVQVITAESQNVKLCNALRSDHNSHCVGTVSQDDEVFHLHPTKPQKPPLNDEPLTLNQILSHDFSNQLTRRQRYSIALLLASSVAQLYFNPWLNTTLTKDDILFFQNPIDVSSHHPFIRQGFSTTTHTPTPSDNTFASLGIILLELCYGRRLEDHDLRKKHPASTGETKYAFDLMAAMKWAQGVREEGGPEYDAAVKWCFLAGAGTGSNAWRGEIIKNVIRPLEKCQEFFDGVGVV